MTYERMMGMGGVAEARAHYDRGTEHYNARQYQDAYNEYFAANRESPSPIAQASMGSAAAALHRCAQAIVHFRASVDGGHTLNQNARRQRDQCLESERQVAIRPLPPELQEPSGTPAAEKQTWWTGDVTGMVGSFFDKLGIGGQASGEAQSVAREEAAASGGPTSIRDVAPETQQRPVVSVEGSDESPWYLQYAPHMVVGGLGVGVVITLLLVMRKR